jgi:hypothetical protein
MFILTQEDVDTLTEKEKTQLKIKWNKYPATNIILLLQRD